jgi:hypothetical protein
VTPIRSAAAPADRHPFEIDTHAPRPERVYNYLVGGGANFAVDQELGHFLNGRSPVTLEAVQANARDLGAFMVRSVRYLAAEAGICQFLNAGTPVPAGLTVHEVAQEVAPAARVVYTSSDPVVLAHAHTLCHGSSEGVAALVHGSLRRDPDEVLAQAAATLDLTRPVAVLLLGYLNFVPDHKGPYGLVARVLEALPSGSHLVIAHMTSDVDESIREDTWKTVDYLTRTMRWPYVLRSRAEIARFLDGLALVEPGFVHVDHWRRYEDQTIPYPEALVPLWAGVGRKP